MLNDMPDDALLRLVDAMAVELIKNGEKDAELIGHSALTSEEVATVMKTNAFLTIFAVFMLKVADQKQVDIARMLVEIWTSDKLQPIITAAFAEEIEDAEKFIQDGIDDIEGFVNGEGH